MTDTMHHVLEWVDGVPMAELPEGTEAHLRTLTEYHARAVARCLDDLTRLARHLARAAAQAVDSSSPYAMGRCDGLSEALRLVSAMRDSLVAHLDEGPGSLEVDDA